MTDTLVPSEAVLLAGATGLVGQALLQALCTAPSPPELHLLLRRKLAAPPPAPVQTHVVDFRLLPPLPAVGTVFCALGTTIRQAGSQAAFRAVDFDAVLHLAQAALRAGARRFAVVSSLGADPTSRNFYNRVKGETESALSEIGFETLLIARPSLLLGDRSALGQPTRVGESLAQWLAWPASPLLPASLRPIKAAVVARAMLAAMNQNRPGMRVLDSAELQQLGHAGRVS